MQDQSTFGRLTLQGALRYDYAYSRFLDQQVGPERFIPVPIVIPAQDGVKGFHDLSPRVGVAYDLFGDGKTSVRVNWGRYLEAGVERRPLHGHQPAVAHRDVDDAHVDRRQRQLLAGLRLLEPRLTGSSLRRRRLLRAVGESEFRQLGAGHRVGSRAAPGMGRASQRRPAGDLRAAGDAAACLGGGGLSPPVVQELHRDRQPAGDVGGLRSATASSCRRIRGCRRATATSSVTSGTSSRSQVRAEPEPGVRRGELRRADPGTWHGVDVNVNVRIRNGLTFQGGTSTGREVADECEVIVDNPSRRDCRVTEPFRTQVKGLGTYTIPKVDVQVSGTFQSRPGGELSANWTVPSALIAPSLGRPLSGNTANVTINVLDPWTKFHDRINQVDLRFSKIFRSGRSRMNIGVDLYNVFNSSAVLTRQQAYSPTSTAWLTPQSVLAARFAKISGQIDF